MSLKNQLTTSDYLPYKEFERFVRALHNDKNYFWEAYAIISFCTACRASDVLNLKWCDILDRKNTTIVEKKTQKTRNIFFSTPTQLKFRQLYNNLGQPDANSYIFISNRTNENKPVTIQYVNRYLKILGIRYYLNIQHFSTHTFRKTFGRYVYECQHKSAESLILLNKIFNHTSIQITKTYIGITQDEINSIYNTIII